MTISDADARNEVLALVRTQLESSQVYMLKVVRARNREKQDYSDSHRSAEIALGKWEQILAYAEKKL